MSVYGIYIYDILFMALKICNYAQKRRICCENSKTRLTKTCTAIFAFAEKLPTSATLMSTSAGCPKKVSFMILNRFEII